MVFRNTKGKAFRQTELSQCHHVGLSAFPYGVWYVTEMADQISIMVTVVKH